MKSNIFIAIWLILALASLTQAVTDLSAVPNGVSKEDIPAYLIAAVPKEMLAFRFAAMKAAFDVLDKTKMIALESNKDVDCSPLNRGKSKIAYRCAWALVAMQYKQTMDNEVKKCILEKWDASLVDKNSPIFLAENQIASLTWGWNRDFLTSTLTDLFLTSNYPEIISAYCGAMSENGEKEDLPVLNKKLDLVRATKYEDTNLQANLILTIQETINNIELGPVGSPSRIGPANVPKPPLQLTKP